MTIWARVSLCTTMSVNMSSTMSPNKSVIMNMIVGINLNDLEFNIFFSP